MFCAAIDWGTTNMRAWLLDQSGNVLASRASDEGMRQAMPDRFEAIMEKHLAEMGAPVDLPVIICGMAGARGGWVEAEYMRTPAQLSAAHESAVKVAHASRDIRILPGACQMDEAREDVMRGEETQLAGAISGVEDDGIFCMPGTHSKWAVVKGGSLTRFTTFMTGEMHGLVSKHSILRDTLGEAKANAESPAFAGAVDEMLEGRGFTEALFSIRASALLKGAEAGDLASRLSGLVIGSEIASAKRAFAPEEVGLVAAGPLSDLYRAALARAGINAEALDGEALARRGLFAAAQSFWGNS